MLSHIYIYGRLILKDNCSQEKKVSKGCIDGLDIRLWASIDEAVVEIFEKYVSKKKFAVAVALNPEKLMSSKKFSNIRSIIQAADILYADGIGISKFLSLKYKTPVSRIAGCDLWEALMEEAGNKKLSVYLVGAKQEIVENVKENLEKKYSIVVVGADSGYFDSEVDQIKKIVHSNANIVVVAMGSPRQEELIYKLKARDIESFCMGVGGSFDVFSGTVKRAPLVFQKTGMEWFYRLSSQPKRIFRNVSLLKYLFMIIFRKIK